MPCIRHSEVVTGLNPCTRCAKTFCADCLVDLKGGRYCADCKAEQVRDIKSGVESSGLAYASLVQRFAALFIDQMVLNFLTVPFAIAMVVVGAASGGNEDAMNVVMVLMYAVAFVGSISYFSLMHQWKGQTLGKMALKIKVVSVNGGKISPGQAWGRTFVWMLLSGCLIDYLPAFFNEEKACIHDKAARTRVVKAD